MVLVFPYSEIFCIWYCKFSQPPLDLNFIKQLYFYKKDQKRKNAHGVGNGCGIDGDGFIMEIL